MEFFRNYYRKTTSTPLGKFLIEIDLKKSGTFRFCSSILNRVLIFLSTFVTCETHRLAKWKARRPLSEALADQEERKVSDYFSL